MQQTINLKPTKLACAQTHYCRSCALLFRNLHHKRGNCHKCDMSNLSSNLTIYANDIFSSSQFTFINLILVLFYFSCVISIYSILYCTYSSTITRANSAKVKQLFIPDLYMLNEYTVFYSIEFVHGSNEYSNSLIVWEVG